MNKKTLIISLIIVGAISIVGVLIYYGVITFPTMESLSPKDEKSVVMSLDDLKDNRFYVWHNEKKNNISEDLEGTADVDVFKICPSGIINWKDNISVAHTVWFSSSNDTEIPTIYPGDRLLYISATKVPFEGIKWERFADYGYTIGVANMMGDNSGHYYISMDADDGYEGFINPESDAYALEKYDHVSELFLDKLGAIRVRDKQISDGGTVYGLKKDTKYLCEWYSGTYYQDFEMTANNHTFCAMESFTTYEYEFLHSNCISITIPEWFKSGYYYINGLGMFRYVSEEDATVYNGEPYDENINWNDPIVLYDKNGITIYDPSTGIGTNESKNEVDVPPVNNDLLLNQATEQQSESTMNSSSQDNVNSNNLEINESDPGLNENEFPDEEVWE